MRRTHIPIPHPAKQAQAQARKQQMEDFLWKKDYTPQDVASVQRVVLQENPLLGFEVHAWAEVFFQHASASLFPNATFQKESGNGSVGGGKNKTTLYILLFHPQMPQIQVPEIYILVNILDVVQPWIHQYNIYLFSKAYRVLDAKYANLHGYSTHPRIAAQTHYLPLITPLQLSWGSAQRVAGSRQPSPQREASASSIKKIYLSPPQTDRQRLYVTLLSAMKDSIQVTHDSTEEGIDGILCILADEATSLYPTWQMEYALHRGLSCICEKSPIDIYHENYYFDKVIFVDRLHPSNLSALVQRIALLPPASSPPGRSRDLDRNLLQWRKVMGLGLL